MKRSGVWGILLAVLLACMPCGALAREQSAQEQGPGEVIEVFLSADRKWVNEPEKIETSLYDADGKPVQLNFSDLLEGEGADLEFGYSKYADRRWNKLDEEGLTGKENCFIRIRRFVDGKYAVLWIGEFAEPGAESAAEGPYIFRLKELQVEFDNNMVNVDFPSFPEGKRDELVKQKYSVRFRFFDDGKEIAALEEAVSSVYTGVSQNTEGYPEEWDSVEATLVDADGNAVEGASDRYDRNESAASSSLSPEPTETPASDATETPAPAPSETSAPEPTEEPTPEPTEAPTPEPTEEPTPTEAPTSEPTEAPTPEPTEAPTPTVEPTPTPTPVPTPTPEVRVRFVVGELTYTGEAQELQVELAPDAGIAAQTAETAAGEGDPAAQPSASPDAATEAPSEDAEAAEVAEVPSEDAETTAQAAEAPSENAEAAADAGEAPSENEDVAANNGGSPSDASAEAQSIEADGFDAASALENARWYHAEIAEGARAEELEEDDWSEGLPTMKDAGTKTFCVRADSDECKFIYVLGDDAAQRVDHADVTMTVVPAKAYAYIALEPAGETAPGTEGYVYDGTEQTLEYECVLDHVKTSPDALKEELTEKLNSDAAGWKQAARGSQTGRDAGRYEVELEPSWANGIMEAAGPNYELTVQWVEGKNAVEIKPCSVTIRSESAFAVYTPSLADAPLKTEQTDISGQDGFVDSYNSGYITATGSQSAVGVGENTIHIDDALKDNANYDIQCHPGSLIVFRQAIVESKEYQAWDEARGEFAQNEETAKQAYDDEDAGFYDGMQVRLIVDGNTVLLPSSEPLTLAYTGEPAAERIEVQFADKNEYLLELVEGTDYELSFRPASETSSVSNDGLSFTDWSDEADAVDAGGSDEADAVDAGEWTLRVKGKGNYTGVIETRIVIEPAALTVGVDMANHTAQVLEEQGDDFSGTFDTASILYDGEEPVCTDPNFEVTFEPMPLEDEPSLEIEDWEYDGSNAAEHVTSGYGGVEGAYTWSDGKGTLKEAPSAAGTYSVKAAWSEWRPAKGTTLKTEFTIAPRPATVRANDVELTFGDALTAEQLDWTVELEGGEALKAELEAALTSRDVRLRFAETSEALAVSEDAASATANAVGEAEGAIVFAESAEAIALGNFQVTFAPGTVAILPRDLSAGRVARDDAGGYVVYDDLDNRLEEGVDFTLAVEAKAAQGDSVTVTGMGNYAGTLETDLDAKPATQLALEPTNADGAPIEALTPDEGDALRFAGSVATDQPVSAASLKLFVNGEEVDAPFTARDDTDMAFDFAVEAFAVSEDVEELRVQVLWEGSEPPLTAERTLPVKRAGGTLWLILAIVLLALAAICAIAYVRLNRKLRSERLKLLDHNSRRSNRTIRERE